MTFWHCLIKYGMNGIGIWRPDKDFLEAVCWTLSENKDDKILDRPFVGPLFELENDDIDGAYYAPLTSKNKHLIEYEGSFSLGAGLGEIMLGKMMYIPRKYIAPNRYKDTKTITERNALRMRQLKNKYNELQGKALEFYNNYSPEGGGMDEIDFYFPEDAARAYFLIDELVHRGLDK